MATISSRYPVWLRKKVPLPSILAEMKALFDGLSLHTVCQSAKCPNQGECFSKGTATFLIMGDICTRNCRFCAVRKGQPSALDRDEPRNIAQAVSRLKLKHAVVTSVTRDDLPDGGATHFARTVSAIRQINPQTTVEVLIPDFQGSSSALRIILDSSPEIITHNVETVPDLYPKIVPKADYYRSLNLLETVKSMNGKILTKSGLMLGLGEEKDEVVAVMEDLRAVRCDILTIGQYLPPSSKHIPPVSYVHVQEFKGYQSLAARMGFIASASGPFVRSSFNASEMYEIASRSGPRFPF